MKKSAIWFLFIIALIGSSQAQVTSLKSGAWEDPSVWSNGQVPGDSTDVLVASGDTITQSAIVVGPVHSCRNVSIEPGGILVAGARDFMVNGTTQIRGLLKDTLNAGSNFFKGRVSILENGTLDTRQITNPTKVQFMGGIWFEGDSFLVNRCSFFTNDQELGGTKPIIFAGNITIGQNVRLINTGHLIYQTGSFQGDTLSSVFVNLGRFDIQTNLNIFERVALDFRTPGNVVNFNRDGLQNVYPVEYFSLELSGQTPGAVAKRNLLGPTHVLEHLFMDDIAQLQLNAYSLVVDSTFTSYNGIFTNDANGSLSCYRLDLHEAILDGSPTDWGTINVQEELRIFGEKCTFTEINLEVPVLRVMPESHLTMSSDMGTWNFQDLYLETNSILDDQSNLSRTVTFSGQCQIAGVFNPTRASYRFESPVHILEGGLFDTQQATGSYEFLGGLINEGEVNLTGGSYIASGTFGGSSPIAFFKDVLIPAGAILNNQSTVGLEFREEIQGADNASLLENQGILIFNSVRNTIYPMSTGSHDFCSFPDNTVEYVAVISNQQVIPGCYQNLQMHNGTKLLPDEVNVYGNLYNEVELKENPDLFNPGPLRIVGTEDQRISGRGTFRTLEIDKPSGELVSEDTFFVNKSLIMTRGILKAQNGGIGLLNSSTLSETESAYVLGRVGAVNNLIGSSTFGGLGIKIQADPTEPMGSTTVIRVTGEAYLPGQLERYYEIMPANNNNLNATIEYYYPERELKGAIEADLDIVSSTDGETFEILGGRNLTGSNIIRKTGVDKFGIIAVKPSSVAVNAFPSPFVDRVKISYVLDKSEMVWVNIFDSSGRVVLREEFEGVAGYNEWILDRHFTGGIYFVSVVASDREGYAKMINVNPPE